MIQPLYISNQESIISHLFYKKGPKDLSTWQVKYHFPLCEWYSNYLCIKLTTACEFAITHFYNQGLIFVILFIGLP